MSMEIAVGSRKCLVCDDENIGFQWTDTHGVAQCVICGAPYRIWHYEDDKRIEKPPLLLLKPGLLEPIRGYWLRNKRPIPGGFSPTGNPRYEVASGDDADEFYRWCETLPAREEV